MKQHFSKGLLVLVYTQIWEFFSTYGMTALLVIYMSKTFLFSDIKAYDTFGAYMALLFMTPILGGYLTDRYISKYYAIVFGGILMAIGHFIIMVPNTVCLYTALSFMILGYGFFTPNLISLVGQLYKNKSGNISGFTLYYIGQNIGAFVAPIACSYVGAKYGWNYGFGIAGIGMITGLCVFIRGQTHLHQEITHSLKISLTKSRQIIILIVSLSLIPLLYELINYKLAGFALLIACLIAIGLLADIFMTITKTERLRIIVILIMMFFMLCFYTFLAQGGSSISLFIQRMIDRRTLGFDILAPMLLSLEPLFMFALAPWLIKCWGNSGISIKTVGKYTLGLSVMGLAFFVFVLAAKAATSHGASPGYIAAAFALFAFAELLIMPVGFALVTSLAPERKATLMVGIWTFSQAIARFFAAKIADQASIPQALLDPVNYAVASRIYANTFAMVAIICVLASLLLLILTPWIRRLIKI